MGDVKQESQGKTRSEILLYLVSKRKASRAEIRKHFRLSDAAVGEHLNKLIRRGYIFRGNHGVYYIKNGYEALKNIFNELVAEGRHLQTGNKGFKYQYARRFMRTRYFKTYIKRDEFREKLFLSIIKGFAAELPQILRNDKFLMRMEEDFNRVTTDFQKTEVNVLPLDEDTKKLLKKEQTEFGLQMEKLRNFGNIQNKKPNESDEDYAIRMSVTSDIKNDILAGSTPESALSKIWPSLILQVFETKQLKDFLASDIDKLYKDITKNPDKKSKISKVNLSKLSRVIIRKKEEKFIYNILTSSPSALEFIMNIDKNNTTFFAGLLEYYLEPFFSSTSKVLETFNKLQRVTKKMGKSQFFELISQTTASIPKQTPLYNSLFSQFILDAGNGELLITKDAKLLLKRKSLPSINNPEEIL